MASNKADMSLTDTSPYWDCDCFSDAETEGFQQLVRVSFYDAALARIRELEEKLTAAEHDRDRWHKDFLEAKYPEVLPTRVDLEGRIRELEAAMREIREYTQLLSDSTALVTGRIAKSALASQSDRDAK